MPDETGTSQIVVEGGDFPERRLWFDYLSKLNDRALHRRALQPTSWVLIGLLAAIVYRAVPQVPSYLKIPDAIRQGLVVLALGADTVIALTVSAALVLEYCSGSRKGRVLAERDRRSFWIVLTQVTLAIAVLGVLHLWLLHRFLGPSITRRSVRILGVFWSVVALLLGIFLSTKGYKARKRHLVDFWFVGGRPLGGRARLGLCLVLCALAALSAFAVGSYAVYLSREPTGWSRQVGAGAESLLVVLIAFHLWVELIRRVSESSYADLELDAVVGSLSAAEIKQRFITEILGPTVTEWLSNLDKKHAAYQSKVRSFHESLISVLSQMETGNEVPVERLRDVKERLRLIREVEQPNLKELTAQVGRLASEYRLHEDESQFLNRLLARWKKRHEEISDWLDEGNARLDKEIGRRRLPD